MCVCVCIIYIYIYTMYIYIYKLLQKSGKRLLQKSATVPYRIHFGDKRRRNCLIFWPLQNKKSAFAAPWPRRTHQHGEIEGRGAWGVRVNEVLPLPPPLRRHHREVSPPTQLFQIQAPSPALCRSTLQEGREVMSSQNGVCFHSPFLSFVQSKSNCRVRERGRWRNKKKGGNGQEMGKLP